nr:aldehyde dehydrogenase family protein [Frankia sp. R43]
MDAHTPRHLVDLGGELSDRRHVQPTVVEGENSMRVSQGAIFGPAVSAARFADLDEAGEIANDSLYGLGAAVWTRDGNAGYRAARAIQAGRVWITPRKASSENPLPAPPTTSTVNKCASAFHHPLAPVPGRRGSDPVQLVTHSRERVPIMSRLAPAPHQILIFRMGGKSRWWRSPKSRRKPWTFRRRRKPRRTAPSYART